MFHTIYHSSIRRDMQYILVMLQKAVDGNDSLSVSNKIYKRQGYTPESNRVIESCLSSNEMKTRK
jgi:hypothetical protein